MSSSPSPPPPDVLHSMQPRRSRSSSVPRAPVGDGFVASLAHPGGNITGTTFLGPELVPKRPCLFKEFMPPVPQFAVLWNQSAFSEQTTTDMVNQAAEAAKSRGLRLRYLDVS